MLELKLKLNRNSMPRTSSLSMIDMQRKIDRRFITYEFGTAGFLNGLTNRPKSLSSPWTRKRKDTLSTMDVESDLKLMAERSEAIVLRKTEEDRTKFCSVRWSVLASLSEYMFGFEVDKFSNKKKRPAVLIINGEVDCTRSISSLLHIYRKRCTEYVSLFFVEKQ